MKPNVCVDAGSEYCPCYLAETKDCILCSHLKGDKVCDCLWQGVCIYNKFIKNNEKAMEFKKDILVDIKDCYEILDNVYLLELNIPKELGEELINPGSYVFLRGGEKVEEKFNIPISVTDVDLKQNILKVVVAIRGPKTKEILRSKKIYIRAPYKNGIFGLKYLKMLQDSKALLLSAGIAQVTLIKIIKQLLKNNNEVVVIIDKNKRRVEYIENYILSNKHIKFMHLDFNTDIETIKNEINDNVKLVYSGGSNTFNKKVMDIVDSIDESISLVISNNNLMCCGEGICGACAVKINDQVVKACKTQIEPRLYLKGALK
ncbi:sulfide/dihydroorotate dehydrogenase-like FAD/NAD-binding protein [Alkalithermobacter paradoxus]|uniref:Dihydroorotate dehydrogenase B, electron transfer subunit n=1 Tax=Alkalithermobacter paradoxus TaxID=29349 RepID=A0A1V4IBL8_9FIRM|nr:dihydroorotate dehydrogenase B, electron transfer subunit [[Clostridium] thermoalcaliphilum]